MPSRAHVLQFVFPFIAERSEGPWPIDPEPAPQPPTPRRRASAPAVDAIADPSTSSPEQPLFQKEAARRTEQYVRATRKLWRLVQERPYSAGMVEHQIDRLLLGKEAA
jgi:hypothetical protein